ncbi:MAG: hypothetical protein SF097_24425 [Acidobacteriota bacterium]|nr:hypothetical protein [Acidobacteriota bacterium]
MTATQMQLEQFSNPPSTMPDVDLPQCCGTGCTVCVLDYPELFSSGQASDTLALLEAVEQAQAQVDKIIANDDLQ